MRYSFGACFVGGYFLRSNLKRIISFQGRFISWYFLHILRLLRFHDGEQSLHAQLLHFLFGLRKQCVLAFNESAHIVENGCPAIVQRIVQGRCRKNIAHVVVEPAYPFRIVQLLLNLLPPVGKIDVGKWRGEIFR